MVATSELRRPINSGLSRAALVERYERDRLGTLRNLVEEHGPVVEVAPGTILVTDPAAVHEVYQRTNSDFLMSLDALFTSTDSRRGTAGLDQWMTARRTALSAIGRETLATHSEWLDTQLSVLADRWLARGVIDDPMPDLRELTLRSFLRFCFGNRDTDRLRQPLAVLAAALQVLQASPMRVPLIGRLLPRHRRAQRARQDFTIEIDRALAVTGAGGLAEAFTDAGLDRPTTVRMLMAVALAGYGVPAAARQSYWRWPSPSPHRQPLPPARRH